MMYIKHSIFDTSSGKNTKAFHFREFKSVSMPEDLIIDSAVKDKLLKYKYPFCVETTERPFKLYTQTDQERHMWIAGFEYLI